MMAALYSGIVMMAFHLTVVVLLVERRQIHDGLKKRGRERSTGLLSVFFLAPS